MSVRDALTTASKNPVLNGIGSGAYLIARLFGLIGLLVSAIMLHSMFLVVTFEVLQNAGALEGASPVTREAIRLPFEVTRAALLGFVFAEIVSIFSDDAPPRASVVKVFAGVAFIASVWHLALLNGGVI